MRILSSLSIILIIFLFTANIFAKESNIPKVFDLIKQKDWSNSYNLARKHNNSVLEKIILSQQYLDNKHQDNSFLKITKFLQKNLYWPQNYLLHLRAESYIDNSTDKALIIEWFKNHKPVTSRGHKYYAIAASELIEDSEKLIKIIKSGWHYGCFSIEEQKDYYKKFKHHLSTQDHIKKIDNHLWQKEISAAKNSLYLVNTDYQKSFNAQIALIRKDKNAQKLFQKIPKKNYTSGLVFSYLNYRKNNSPASSEINKLIQIVSSDLKHVDDFWKIQSYLAREFIEKKKYREAYRVAAGCLSNNIVNKSDAEYLSGWLALRFLKKPKLALEHFHNFNKIVKTPISKSRGIYWLARSYEANGDKEKSSKLYELSATKYPYSFYGQLAAIATNNKKRPLPKNIDLTEHQETATNYYNKNEIIQATSIIAKHGSNDLGQAYISSVMSRATKADALNIANILNYQQNIHHMAWLAKAAMQKHVFIQDHAYPTPYNLSNSPIETPLIYSIIKQESVFDTNAMSSAQARGLMQIIEKTACDTAKRLSTYCRISKLTTEPQYNIKLGSNYLKQMIDEYNGSYILAIASYNAGPHNVNKWIKIYGDPRKMKNWQDVLDWVELIPFYETRNYVQRVLENLQVYRTITKKNNSHNILTDIQRGSNQKTIK